MNKRTIDDCSFTGKRVLMRVDFNTPLKDGRVSDNSRVVATLPSIHKILNDGGSLVLMSHLGRPKGQIVPEMSLAPVAEELAKLLQKPVKMAPDCIGKEVTAMAEALQPGEILLLENLRFHDAEKKCDPEFSKGLAALGEIYVNDAFGTSHRGHASITGVTEHLKPAVAGYLLKKEIEFLGGALAAPKHPFTAVIGGAKVSGKIDVIENLIGVVDQFIIGGGMAFTFLKAQGGEIGKSLLEDDKISLASEILAKAQAAGSPILLPTDILCGEKLEADTPTSVHPAKEIPSNLAGFDIGPDSIKTFCEALKKSAMVVWNGPMGVFEVSPFHTGTETLARTLGSLTDAITIVGGGDSIAAVEQFGLHDQMTHVSTGGGASLEMMEGKILPGITALDDKE